MEEEVSLPDVEYLHKLRLDYLQALQLEDYRTIEAIIVPEFWRRFAKYYEAYTKTWKEVSLSHLPVQVIIDPSRQKQVELDWAENVLRGHIDLIR